MITHSVLLVGSGESQVESQIRDALDKLRLQLHYKYDFWLLIKLRDDMHTELVAIQTLKIAVMN